MGRLRLMAFGVVLVGLIFYWGVGCSSDKPKDNENIAKGKSLLAEGNGDEARDIFSAELNGDPDSCNGRYGRILADNQSLLKLFNDFLATGAGLVTAGFGPRMVVDAYPYLDDLLNPFHKILVEMEADADRVAELNCTFYTEAYPVSLNTNDNQPIINAVLTGEWDQVQALFIGGQIHMMLGLIDYISAHNLMVDVESILNMIQTGNIQGSQLIYQVRSLGGFMHDNPYFLTKSENRWDLVTQARQEWIEGLSEDSAFLQAVDAGKSDPSQAILGFIDLDGDGFDAGDELSLGINRLTISGGTTLIGRVKFQVPDYLSRDVVLGLEGLLDKAQTALEAVDQGGSSERIGLADLNPAFIAFSGEISSAIPFVQLNPLPDVIQLDLKAFFTDPKPVRDFLPVIEEVRSGVYEFMLEGEAVPDGSCASCCMADGVTIAAGDVSHFSNGYLIPADCITAQSGGVVNPIPYIAFSDPNFNGLLWLNLDPISDNVGSCPADPAGYLPADRYALNKLISSLLVSTTSIPDFGISF
ncbi:MAG: hypothetical protein NT056_06930 [Proteobacteria bacterium]|nr:hypothetical protein [Pseudomonadota bacterium]